jgi:hypothetical protein
MLATAMPTAYSLAFEPSQFKSTFARCANRLTHLLSTSLGGNASTAMLACISAVDFNREETQSTLRYAARTKKIVNDAHLNEVDNLESFMENYWAEIEVLRRQISDAQEHADTKVEEATTLTRELEDRAKKDKEERDSKIADLRAELAHETGATQDALRHLETEHEIRMSNHTKAFDNLRERHSELQKRHAETKREFSQAMAATLARKNQALRAATETGEQKAMKVEEIELFRLEEQQEFDADQHRRESLLEAKEAELQGLRVKLGNAPEQQKVLVELTQEQEKHLLERDKRIAALVQAQEEMAELAVKVSNEAKTAREAADAAEARAVAAEARHGASLEEAAGKLLQEARGRVIDLESALAAAHEAQIKLEESHTTMAEVSYLIYPLPYGARNNDCGLLTCLLCGLPPLQPPPSSHSP